MNDLIYNYIISGLNQALILSLYKNNHIKNVKKIVMSSSKKITSKYIINELLKMECGNSELLCELTSSQYVSIPSKFWSLNIEDKNILINGWLTIAKEKEKEDKLSNFICFLQKINNIDFAVFILNRFLKSKTDKNIKIEPLGKSDKVIDYNRLSESEKDLIYRNYRIYLCDKRMKSYLTIEDLMHKYPVLYHFFKDEELICLIDKNVRKVRTLETSLYFMFNGCLSDRKETVYEIIEFIKNNIIKKGKISKKFFTLSLEFCVKFGELFDLNMCYAIEQTLRCQNNVVVAMLKYLGINNKEIKDCLYEMYEPTQIDFLNRILILKDNCSRKTFAKFKTFLSELPKERSEDGLSTYEVIIYIVDNCSHEVWTRYFRHVDISSFEKEDFLDLFSTNEEGQLNLYEQYKNILKKISSNNKSEIKLTKNDLMFWKKNKDALIKLEDKEIITYMTTFIAENGLMKKDKLYMKLGDILKINSFGIENNIDTSQVIKLLEFFKDKTIENERRLDDMQLESNLFLLRTYLTLNNLGPCIECINDLRMYKVLQIFEGLEFVKNLEVGNLIRFLYSDSNISKFLTSQDRLGLSEKFINKYESSIIDFITSEEMQIAMAYFKRLESKTRKNFALIIKAIIADKYDEIKWDRHDLSKEINSDITQKLFQKWKDNKKSVHGNIKIEECDDFNSIMTIGEIPVHTCQSYISGGYSDCLLANFDSSKKILKIYKDGIQIGRAILRLTLCSKEEVVNDNLVFKDVETVGTKQKSNIDKIIFVEKMYSQLSTSELRKACGKELVSFLKEKAKDIDSKLAFAKTYSWINELEDNYYQIMISESKNGNQYIDSMRGESKRSSKHTWEYVNCYTIE